MAAQKGSLVLIKVGNGGGPETFTTIGGLRTTRFVLNNQVVDTTNKDSGAWRSLLAGAGIRSITLSGNGVFTDTSSEELVRGYAFSNSINNYEFYFGGNDKFAGAFQITSYERSGNFDGEETYAITFESAGTITSTIV